MTKDRRRPNTKFYDTKGTFPLMHAAQLARHNPALLAILTLASWYAWEHWRKKLTLTSVFRIDNDPKGMHGGWRAADCRVYSETRDGPEVTEITGHEWVELAAFLNNAFRYGRTWLGRKTEVCIIRASGTDSDTARHVHIQTPKRWWR